VFFVQLFDAIGATIAEEGVGTVLDDDGTGWPWRW
jgi:hypothetical protein